MGTREGRGGARRWAILGAALLALGCNDDMVTNVVEPIPGPGDYLRYLNVDFFNRSYRVHVPPGVDVAVPSPVIMVLHGYPWVDMALVTDMNHVADSLDFIAVYPNGRSNLEWVHGCATCSPNAVAGVDDVSYFRGLLDNLAGGLAVDEDRVYVTGFSNGGMMTYRLACDLADRLAAVAPVGAGMWDWHVANCSPSRALPILMINGTEDPSFPWEGVELDLPYANVRQVPVVEHVDFWASENGCDAMEVVEDLEDRYDDGTEAEVWRFLDCRAETRFYRIVGGGHTWPNMPVEFGPALGTKSLEVDGTRTVVDFFLSHVR